MTVKYSVILGNLGNTCDRFLSSGYKDQPPKETMIRQAAEIPGVQGVELVGTWDVTPQNVDQIGGLLSKYGLACASIIPDHFSQKRWGRGAFTAKDPAIRATAFEKWKRDLRLTAIDWSQSAPSSSASRPGTLASGGRRSLTSSPGYASCCICVFMSPGSTQYTRQPGFSTARIFDNCSSAALLDPYPPQPAYASTPASLVTLIMRAPGLR